MAKTKKSAKTVVKTKIAEKVVNSHHGKYELAQTGSKHKSKAEIQHENAQNDKIEHDRQLKKKAEAFAKHVKKHPKLAGALFNPQQNTTKYMPTFRNIPIDDDC